MAIKDVVDRYKKVMGYNEDESQQLKDELEHFLVENFHRAPNYAKLIFDNHIGETISVDARIQTVKDSNVLELLTLKQDSDLSGNIFDYNSQSWIVYDYNPHKVTPKIIALRMNKVLRFKDENDELFVFPCTLTDVKPQSLFRDNVVSLPRGEVEVVAQKNATTEKLEIGMRTQINTGYYEVVHVDKESKDNIITFRMESVNKRIDDEKDKDLSFEDMIY